MEVQTMTDIFSKDKRSKNMSKIGPKDTGPEIKVRKWLFSRGLGYRLHADLLGKPDIVFPSKKVAIFVNGCFWHLHGCKYSKFPTTNKNFWKKKLTKNKKRDHRVTKNLKERGWRIITIWQCEIRTRSKFKERMQKLMKEIKVDRN